MEVAVSPVAPLLSVLVWEAPPCVILLISVITWTVVMDVFPVPLDTQAVG